MPAPRGSARKISSSGFPSAAGCARPDRAGSVSGHPGSPIQRAWPGETSGCRNRLTSRSFHPSHAHFLFTPRTFGAAAKVESTISSPVTVLISWCTLTTTIPVISMIIDSRSGRAVSRSCACTCLSKSRPFPAGSDMTRCCSAAVQTPFGRTTRVSSIKCARMSLGPRPMNSCSNRAMPSQTAASISPCVLMVTPSAPGHSADCFAPGRFGGFPCRKSTFFPRYLIMIRRRTKPHPLLFELC